MKNNKMMSFMIVFFMGNMISGNLLSTGAFEIFVDDKLVFSKL